MGYQNYNNRGGYNNRGYRGGYDRPYDNRGGYDRPYENRPYDGGYQPQPNCPYEVGQIVWHRASGTELSVIRIGREQVECRTPNLDSQWFYLHELMAEAPDKK